MVAEAWERVRVAPNKAAGCDEAGRGPLAGNVIAAAVILDHREGRCESGEHFRSIDSCQSST